MSEGRIRRLFCFGLGYSARVLAQQLAAEGWQIAGTGRSEKSKGPKRARSDDQPPTEKKADPKKGQARSEKRRNSDDKNDNSREDKNVVGLGDHVPAFLQTPARASR